MLIEEARSRIKTSQILNRLNTHILSKTNVMTESQVRAALGVLRKVIPDLANVELQAGDGGPILIVTGIMRPDEPKPMIEQDKSAQVIDVMPVKVDQAAPAEAKALTDKVE